MTNPLPPTLVQPIDGEIAVSLSLSEEGVSMKLTLGEAETVLLFSPRQAILLATEFNSLVAESLRRYSPTNNLH